MKFELFIPDSDPKIVYADAEFILIERIEDYLWIDAESFLGDHFVIRTSKITHFRKVEEPNELL